MTDVAIEAPALHARTTPGHDPAEDLGRQEAGTYRFEWWHDGVGFVATGVAAPVPARDVTGRLTEITVADEVGRPGTGAIAVGALTFADAPSAELVIPRRVVGRAADGTTWTTEIRGTGAQDLVAPTDPAPGHGPGQVTITDPTDAETWAALVRDALAAIEVGPLTKVVLTRTLEVATEHDIDPRWLLARLREREPGRYLYAAPTIVGASPELLVERLGSSVVSRPLAGSWPADHPDAVAVLAASRKDHAEHRYVVDAVEQVLRGACDAVRVGETSPIALPDVVHLATTVTGDVGTLTPSALDLALRLHPTPAVGGTPVDAALAFITQHEPIRHHYAAPVGWVDARGDGQFAVALRNAELLGPRRALVRAGAGIVAGSNPATEWREIDAKLAPALHAFTA